MIITIASIVVLLGANHRPPVNSGLYLIPSSVESEPVHNTDHVLDFGKDAVGYGLDVLEGVDKVQSTALDGGGYFIGVKAQPPESPVGYNLSLEGQPLLAAPRTTSYCSGSSYAALVEALNLILPLVHVTLPPDHVEALRMQEPDGTRREDKVKVWGWWNADGFGNDFALVQLTNMGEKISPLDARPGDFVNIAWKSGLGHSTVFLGWVSGPQEVPSIKVWSSQASTNGLGDLTAPLSSIRSLCFVRLTHPERAATFSLTATVDPTLAGDPPPSNSAFQQN